MPCPLPPHGRRQIMTFANNLHHAFQEWSPTIDGVELTDDPRLLMAAGKFAPGVPVIIGANADEGAWRGASLSMALLLGKKGRVPTQCLRCARLSSLHAPPSSANAASLTAAAPAAAAAAAAGTLFNPAPHDLNESAYAKTIATFLNGTNSARGAEKEEGRALPRTIHTAAPLPPLQCRRP